MVAAAVRETAEETGVRLQPGQLRCVVVVHHHSPSGQARVGWFFTAEPGWAGDPVNQQFAVHWQEPGSPVHYDPGYEYELTLLPSVPSAVHLRQEACARWAKREC